MNTVSDRWFGARTLQLSLHLVACGLAALACAGPADPAEEPAGGAETFKLHEASVFEQNEDNFLRGQSAMSREKPFKEVKAYPVFASKNPVYGSVQFRREAREGRKPQVYYFAVDESRGTGKGYDRFYFDANQDLDLSNDPVLKPQQDPPEKARLPYSNIKQQIIFDVLAVEFNLGPEGKRAIQLLPRLAVSRYDTNEYKQVSFVRTQLWTGDIRIGGRDYAARLGNDYFISGRLDTPSTVLILSPKGQREGRTYWWGGDRLTAAHKIGGRFYTFSASPTGDEFTVHPYAGDLGTFEVGAGGRKLDTLTVSGSLEAKGRAVPVGGEVVDGSPKEARRCQIPAGDYRPNYITVGFGKLRIAMSFNYHSEGNPRGWSDRPEVYAITIRKDKPFVFDFSNKPEVMFASPARGDRVKPGDELEVKAVLVDPQLDIMIRGLDDTSRKQTKTEDGRPLGYERFVSLDPKVLITRLNGEKVAEGVMPFG